MFHLQVRPDDHREHLDTDHHRNRGDGMCGPADEIPGL